MTPKSKTTLLYKRLRWVRIVLALILLVEITLSFTFFGKELQYINQVLHLQFIPSLIAFAGGSLVALITIILVTLICGRLYCSVICPLGIYQDVVSRAARIFKTKKQRQYHFHKPHNGLRFGILAALLLLLLVGVTYPLVFLDPYSNYGRIARELFNPVLQLINNGLSNIFPGSVYFRPFAPIILGSFLITMFFFIVVTVMSALRGRLYCNTICPIGSLLGAASRISLFRPAIDKDACVRCGQCSKQCKSECIDLETKTIDEGRCVVCLDCMSSCPKGGVRYVSRYGTGKKKRIEGERKEKSNEEKVEMRGRREAIAALGTVAAVVAIRDWKGDRINDGKRHDFIRGVDKIHGIIPPGGRSIEHLIENCTACNACISACPNGIISMATGEYGLNGLFLPVIGYDKSFCGYNCRRCMEVCPNDALVSMPLEQKQLVKIGQAKFTIENCVVYNAHTDCGACDEHCPTKAITMRDAEDGSGLRFPHIEGRYCIGCGGCEYICPTSPKAMKVIPLKKHITAQPPKKEEQEEKDVSDFGF